MMRRALHTILCRFAGFRAKESGAILVEFALVFPLMLLFLGVTLEMGRLFWGYQAAVSGVRDASRYYGRAADTGICGLTAGQVDTLWEPKLTEIVMEDVDLNDILGTGAAITLTSMTVSVNCIDDSGEDSAPNNYAADEVVVGRVSATFQITFPAAGLLNQFGGNYSSITTTVNSDVRIYGQ